MKYPLTSRILHWLMAAIILFLLGLGIYMVDFLSKEAPNRMEIYNLHKSLGVIILVLIFIRILNRLAFKTPTFPNSLPKIEKIAANLAHFALYFLMIAMPLSGYLMSNSFGYHVNFFGIELPMLMEKNLELAPIISQSHTIFGYSLIAIISLHILGVIKHRFFDRPENDVLKRMI